MSGPPGPRGEGAAPAPVGAGRCKRRTLLLSWPGLTGPPSIPGAAGGYWVPRSRFARRGMTLETVRLGPFRTTDPAVPGVSSATPPALRPERPMGAEKAWTGDLQTPCGSAGEARLYIAAPSRRSLTPRPVPDRRPGGGSGLGKWRVANGELSRMSFGRVAAHQPNRSFPRKREPSGCWAKFLGPRFRGDERKTQPEFIVL